MNVHILASTSIPFTLTTVPSAKFNSNSYETDNSVAEKNEVKLIEKKGYEGIFCTCPKIVD
jgi:hypothetical protein